MNAKTLEALDCPFCSGPGTIDHGGPHEPNDWCGGCRACDYSLEFRATREEAIAAWNRRASSTARSPVEAAAQTVIAAARQMPRRTPAPGGCGTAHPFEIEAGTVWTLDRALTDYDAALTAIHPQAEGETGWRLVPDRPTEAMIDAARGLCMYFNGMADNPRWTLGQHADSGGYGEGYAHLLTDQERAACHFPKAHQASLIYRAMIAAAPPHPEPGEL